jgi:hypothetical protein
MRRAALVLAGVMVAGCGPMTNDSIPREAAPTVAAPPEFPGMLAVGSPVQVARPGGAGHAHAAIDEMAYDDLDSAIVGQNLGVFRKLMDDGRVFIVPNGTTGVVVDRQRGRYRVQFANGPHPGAEGWVDQQYVSVAQPTPELPIATARPEREPVRPPKPASPRQSKAARDLNIARNLQRSGKIEAAVWTYRDIVRDHPGTPEATEATQQLERLAAP